MDVYKSNDSSFHLLAIIVSLQKHVSLIDNEGKGNTCVTH